MNGKKAQVKGQAGGRGGRSGRGGGGEGGGGSSAVGVSRVEGGRYLGPVARVVLVGKGQAAQGSLAAKGPDCSHDPLLHPLPHQQLPRPIIAQHL